MFNKNKETRNNLKSIESINIFPQAHPQIK